MILLAEWELGSLGECWWLQACTGARNHKEGEVFRPMVGGIQIGIVARRGTGMVTRNGADCPFKGTVVHPVNTA